MDNETLSDRLAHYESCIFTSNLCGVGLLGSIVCVAAGALSRSPDIFRSSYFLVLGVSAFLVGWSRFSTSRFSSEIQRKIDTAHLDFSSTIKTPEVLLSQRNLSTTLRHCR